MNGTVKKLVIEPENKEVCDSKEILTELHKFYSNLFERKRDVTPEKCKHFLDTINVPTILNEHKEESNMPITLDELTENLFSMNGGKSPGNDGLTVEFYKHFWEDIKNVYFESIAYSISVGFLSVSYTHLTLPTTCSV